MCPELLKRKQAITMAKTGCICRGRTKPFPELPQYPTLAPDGDPVKLLHENGYFVVRGLFSQEEVEQSKGEISSIVREWYAEFQKKGEDGKDWEVIANRLPAWKEGRIEPPENPEMGIRRLYRMSVRNKLFEHVCKHDKILSIITKLLGPDIKLLQSMALLKPPGSGEKIWHQDNGYFRLTPCKILGVWIALDPTDCANGCMHILPRSHGRGFYKHAASVDHHIDYGMVDLPNADDVMPIILKPGDTLIFHGEMAHYTPPNVSNTRRRSLQFHYASSQCQHIKCPKKEEGGEEKEMERPSTQEDGKPHYFDCDPSCEEAKYFYYSKGELLVTGRDYGEGYI